MKFAIKRSNLKTIMMPLAMVFGAIFYPWMDYITFLSPYLIFIMLFITYCKLTPHDFKPGKFDLWLLGVQVILACIVYLSIFLWNRTLAEGVFICFFIPTATAAPVITSMLGGSISKVATFSLICNTFVAFVGPLILAAIGDHPEMTFASSFLLILKQVFPLILMPLALAMAMRKFTPSLHKKVVNMQQLSFYCWVISLFIVVGSCTSFAIRNWTPESTGTMVMLALGALAACLIQFKCGREIGGHFGDKVSGGQSLGQKNTVLAVWLALAYLNPLSSIAPAAYVAWQNIINSWQLMRHQSRINVLSSVSN
ncbi:MAG: transporter [Muribaculaceae bacterium]|nr:transporter [Muribaculaceae bacterium]